MGSITCEQALNLGIESREWPEMGTYSQVMHGRRPASTVEYRNHHSLGAQKYRVNYASCPGFFMFPVWSQITEIEACRTM